MLGREFSLKTSPDIPQVDREIFDERSFEAIVSKWNQPAVNEALSAAQRSLYNPQTNKTIYMAAGGRGYLDACAKFRPDWTGTQPTAPQPVKARQVGKSWNILPGDTKLSKKWSSNKIVCGRVKADIKCQWLRPLAQIYTYCVRANARYGYIITDKELVVFRVCPTPQTNEPAATIKYQVARPQHPKDPNDPNANGEKPNLSHEQDESNDPVMSSVTKERLQNNGKLEFRAIPWTHLTTSNSLRSNQLTVDLALWWLHIMAAVSSNIKEQYPPLKGIAQPMCFREVITSEQLCPKLAKLTVGSRKRGYSTFAEEEDMTGTSQKCHPSGFGYLVNDGRRIMAKRLRANLAR